jgi:hypothetical protein
MQLCVLKEKKSLILESAVSKEWLTNKDLKDKATYIIFRASVEGGHGEY